MHIHKLILTYVYIYHMIERKLSKEEEKEEEEEEEDVWYGVSTMSRLLKIIVLFCKRAL